MKIALLLSFLFLLLFGACTNTTAPQTTSIETTTPSLSEILRKFEGEWRYEAYFKGVQKERLVYFPTDSLQEMDLLRITIDTSSMIQPRDKFIPWLSLRLDLLANEEEYFYLNLDSLPPTFNNSEADYHQLKWDAANLTIQVFTKTLDQFYLTHQLILDTTNIQITCLTKDENNNDYTYQLKRYDQSIYDIEELLTKLCFKGYYRNIDHPEEMTTIYELRPSIDYYRKSDLGIDNLITINYDYSNEEVEWKWSKAKDTLVFFKTYILNAYAYTHGLDEEMEEEIEEVVRYVHFNHQFKEYYYTLHSLDTTIYYTCTQQPPTKALPKTWFAQKNSSLIGKLNPIKGYYPIVYYSNSKKKPFIIIYDELGQKVKQLNFFKNRCDSMQLEASITNKGLITHRYYKEQDTQIISCDLSTFISEKLPLVKKPSQAPKTYKVDTNQITGTVDETELDCSYSYKDYSISYHFENITLKKQNIISIQKVANLSYKRDEIQAAELHRVFQNPMILLEKINANRSEKYLAILANKTQQNCKNHLSYRFLEWYELVFWFDKRGVYFRSDYDPNNYNCDSFTNWITTFTWQEIVQHLKD
ncbi:MAG: hypothetical protein ACRBFS_26965 [Aureispira sp.]